MIIGLSVTHRVETLSEISGHTASHTTAYKHDFHVWNKIGDTEYSQGWLSCFCNSAFLWHPRHISQKSYMINKRSAGISTDNFLEVNAFDTNLRQVQALFWRKESRHQPPASTSNHYRRKKFVFTTWFPPLSFLALSPSILHNQPTTLVIITLFTVSR